MSLAVILAVAGIIASAALMVVFMAWLWPWSAIGYLSLVGVALVWSELDRRRHR